MAKAITFFFGSGADKDYCEEMPTGMGFISALLCNGQKEAREKMLGEHCARWQLITHNSMKFFLQTIYANKEDSEEIFGRDITEKCIRVYDPNDSESDDDKKDVKTYCKQWYYITNEAFDKIDNSCGFVPKTDVIKKFFLEKGQLFDTLDEKFNSLRFPTEVNKAKRVINAYTSIFVLMLSKVYKTNFAGTFQAAFELLKRPYQCTKQDSTTYYEVLAEYLSDRDTSNWNFITTNYTNLAEQCFSQKADGHAMVYLHGKLTWFEDLQNLTVYDITNEEECLLANKMANERMLMPFILIPSGVKPLVCVRQIEEFHKFIAALKESDQLCIIGYHFNSEDNHVNAIIGDWLRAEKKHRLIYFNWKGDVKLSKLKWMETFEIKENGDVADLRSTDCQIISISIDESNAIGKLKEFLDSE